MKTIKTELDIETYVRCEKAARANGFSSVEEWLSFLISEKVGHISFARKR